MKDLPALQQRVALALTALCFLHAGLLAIAALALKHDPLMSASCAALLACIPAALIAAGRPSVAVAAALGIVLVAQTAILVALASGHPWQVEMHFYFFADLAMLAAFCNVLVLVLAATAIALHHLALNIFVPWLLYPGGTDLPRVAFHASVVAVETGMLAVFARMTSRSLNVAAMAREEAQTKTCEMAVYQENLQDSLFKANNRSKQLKVLLEEFQTEIGRNLGVLKAATAALDSTADEFSRSTALTKTETSAVLAAAEGADAALARIARAGRDFENSIRAVGEHASRTRQTGASAEKEADASTLIVRELQAMATHIGEAGRLIANIAGQTNLLALNAAIEAGRAGAHGRGFAVVAGEVKSLATETATATGLIQSMVEGIEQATARSRSAIASIRSSVHALSVQGETVGDAIEANVKGATEIAIGIEAAATRVGQVAEAIDGIERAAENNSNGAVSIRAASSNITDQLSLIRGQVSTLSKRLLELDAVAFNADAPALICGGHG